MAESPQLLQIWAWQNERHAHYPVVSSLVPTSNQAASSSSDDDSQEDGRHHAVRFSSLDIESVVTTGANDIAFWTWRETGDCFVSVPTRGLRRVQCNRCSKFNAW